MKNIVPELMMGMVIGLCALVAGRGTADSWDATHTVSVLNEGQVQIMPMEDYLVGVLMSELTVSFQPEAMKAQAVASRTFALHCQKHDNADVCHTGACCQAWNDLQALQERCGKYYDEFYAAAKSAVQETDGLILTYRGEPIDAVFFACSGGQTEASADVLGKAVPYLQSVDSPGEEFAYCYESDAVFSKEEFAEIIAGEAPAAEFPQNPDQWIGEIQRTDAGGIISATICGVPIAGARLRALFSLKSALFMLSYENGQFIFSVKGSGHRVGMSQFGAQAMALGGKSYREILAHYYPNTIQKRIEK